MLRCYRPAALAMIAKPITAPPIAIAIKIALIERTEVFSAAILMLRPSASFIVVVFMGVSSFGEKVAEEDARIPEGI
jgi:hypothetical protein